MKPLHLLLAAAAGAGAAAFALRRRQIAVWRREGRVFVDAKFLDLLIERGARSEIHGDQIESRLGGHVFTLREVPEADIEQLNLSGASRSVYEASGPLELLFLTGLLLERP